VPSGAGTPKPQPANHFSEIVDARFTSRNDRFVLLAAEAGGARRLWLAQDGQEPVAFGPELVGQMSDVSPDDKVIATRTRGEVFLVPLGAGAGPARKLPGLGPGDAPLTFSPDATRLLVGRRDTGLVSYELSTGKTTLLLPTPSPDPTVDIKRGFVARDAKSYAYSFGVKTSVLYLVEGLR
jgi:hypothetical protein